MRVAVMLGRKAEDERNQHKAEGPFLFGCKDEDLAACWLGRVAFRLHLARRLTWSERYFDRIFS